MRAEWTKHTYITFIAVAAAAAVAACISFRILISLLSLPLILLFPATKPHHPFDFWLSILLLFDLWFATRLRISTHIQIFISMLLVQQPFKCVYDAERHKMKNVFNVQTVEPKWTHKHTHARSHTSI